MAVKWRYERARRAGDGRPLTSRARVGRRSAADRSISLKDANAAAAA